MNDLTSRRSFLSLGATGGAALFCTIGGERVDLGARGGAARAAAAASKMRPPAFVGGPEDFPVPQPSGGGVEREYWIQAEAVRWDVAPTGRDDWHGMRLPPRRRRTFTAFAYRLMAPDWERPLGPARMPGPLLVAEAGDVLVVHFRNALTRPRQAATMHPHGVRYNPAHDGVYLGRHTYRGGWVAPGETFTYRWECPPEAVGAWPYHDHGPNHTANTFRGLFGAIVVRPRGERPPDVEQALFLHQLGPNVTGLDTNFQCINGRAYAGNTPTVKAKVGQDVALHVFGMDDAFHDFHIHGHRWLDDSRSRYVDTPSVGPNEGTTVRFVEDNPGRWLYHCHVFMHQDMGMTGWYLVSG